MIRKRVILYNPKAVFWTMPLALVAVGSALDRSKFEVIVVDGRLETDPVRTLLEKVNDNTVCVGVTVLTGAPIRDALALSKALKGAHPCLPIIWGGWHPSLFPEQCLKDASIDAVVVGQGEETFRELVDCYAAGCRPSDLPGSRARVSHDIDGLSQSVEINAGAERSFLDINSFPSHDYSLIEVERYFRQKGARRLDYVSSQGCRFRCSFCSDPAVYRRGWYGLSPERVVSELNHLRRNYGYAEVSFQDETFFTSAKRVAEIAEGILRAGIRTVWSATMRSDQGARLDEPLFELCRRSGLKRVMIGVESGSPEMLRRIKKDITLEQVYDCAAKCSRYGIGATLNFIVGFPGESEESILQTLNTAARLREMSANFEVCVFYFKPYPGNALAEQLLNDGYEFPTSLEGWSVFDFYRNREKWVTARQQHLVDGFRFYQNHAFSNRHPIVRWPMRALSRWRIGRHMYALPIEKIILEAIRPSQRLS